MTICSHTIVKNGMPYVTEVLKAVAPFMDKMLVTISEKSNDGTKEAILSLSIPKMEIDYENVSMATELTNERQKQVNKTKEDWILFLDDDDLWPQDSLEKCLEKLSGDIDGLAVSGYQMVDETHYDPSFLTKWFTKFFRNDNINYRGGWPNDWIYRGNQRLYWKDTDWVIRVPERFYHLALLKPYSFRSGTRYEYKIGQTLSLEKPLWIPIKKQP